MDGGPTELGSRRCGRCGSTVLGELDVCLQCLLKPLEFPFELEGLELLDVIGQGGMGIVYRARQTRLDRIVAVKILHPSFAHGESFRRRFEREARLLARLNHPNIVTLHDWGETEDCCYLVMELVDGHALSKILPLESQRAAQVAADIAGALAYAHGEGVIHRDIKPANVLMTADGRVKLVDFGIARLGGAPGTGGTITTEGAMVGTPYFMAPEVSVGAQPDARMDIYSVGILLYQTMTGEFPIGDYGPLPSPFDTVARRAFATRPADRFQSAAELREALTTALSTETSTALAPERTRLRRGLIAVLALLLVSAGIWGATTWIETSRTPRAASARAAGYPDAAPPKSQERTTSPVDAAPAPVSPVVSSPETAAATRRPSTRRRAKEPGTIVIRVRPWAQVQIDGVARGQCEPPAARYKLPPGSHVVVLSNPVSGKTVRERVKVRSGREVTIRADLRERAEP